MTDAAFTPESIDVRNETGDVMIVWKDGHSSHLPISRLRTFCPCAECQGHGVGLKPIEHKASGIHSAEFVGQYAIQFFFNDNHSTGIYRFNYLRKLDPTEADRWGSPEQFGRGG